MVLVFQIACCLGIIQLITVRRPAGRIAFYIPLAAKRTAWGFVRCRTDGRTDRQTDGRTERRAGGRTNGRTGRRTDERTKDDGRTDERTNGRSDVRKDGRMDGRTDGRPDGRAGERADERTDGRADGRTNGRDFLSTDCCIHLHVSAAGSVNINANVHTSRLLWTVLRRSTNFKWIVLRV